MPVQNSNFKISARPDLATNQLQILIPATINSLVCQKGQFTLQLCPRVWFVKTIWLLHPESQNWKITINFFACPNRWFLGNYLSKRQVGRVLAKSLVVVPISHQPRARIILHKLCRTNTTADGWILAVVWQICLASSKTSHPFAPKVVIILIITFSSFKLSRKNRGHIMIFFLWAKILKYVRVTDWPSGGQSQKRVSIQTRSRPSNKLHFVGNKQKPDSSPFHNDQYDRLSTAWATQYSSLSNATGIEKRPPSVHC